MFRIFFYSLFFVLWPVAILTAHADTVISKDGNELKGIVVEDYRDRIVFSTPDGEVTLLKSEISELYYDSEEDNLISLAEQARQRQDYVKSYGYYDMAYRINPGSKAAKDGMVFLQGYLFRKEEMMKQDEISRRQAFESYGTVVSSEKSEDDRQKELEAELKKKVGITIVIRQGFPVVDSLAAGSPAYSAGIKNGDFIAAIWGRLCGYMSMDEVITLFTEKASIETKCSVLRDVQVEVNQSKSPFAKPNALIDASLTMEFDGLTVSGIDGNGRAQIAGLKAGDLIMAINGESTRYMPLKNAFDRIRSAKNGSVSFTIQREIIIW